MQKYFWRRAEIFNWLLQIFLSGSCSIHTGNYQMSTTVRLLLTFWDCDDDDNDDDDDDDDDDDGNDGDGNDV